VTSSSPPRGSSRARRAAAIALITVVVGVVLTAGAFVSGALGRPQANASTVPASSASASPAPAPTTPAGTPATTPSASPSTPPPTVVLVPAPLTGLLVSPGAALRHPIAVMIDDHRGARPQAGFNAASIVWQAPAEGGIPRYMLIFQDRIPGLVGPVRSSREYFIEWAAEYRSMYVHAGGSPQALLTLRQSGTGQLVYNAEDFRWEGRYLWRVKDRFAPHNVFTDGTHLRDLAGVLHVPDRKITPIWSFEPASIEAEHPLAGSIAVTYPYERITYRYDPLTDAYHRYIDGARKPQVDFADGRVVAPKNVVILRMHFGPLSGPHPEKGRLEASDVGTGPAWIATGGVTIQGTWRKASKGGPTLLFGSGGLPVVLTAGQTFVQVLPYGYPLQIRDGAGAPSIHEILGMDLSPS
jgi:hypothetical protein